MKIALQEAAASRKRGDPGIGAAIVSEGRLVALGGNEVHSTCDITAHAEMVAIRRLKLGAGTLPQDLTMYTTFEPCPMCSGAALVAGVKRIVVGGWRIPGDLTWGSYTPKLCEQFVAPDGPAVRVEEGPYAEECVDMRNRTY